MRFLGLFLFISLLASAPVLTFNYAVLPELAQLKDTYQNAGQAAEKIAGY